MVQVLSVEQSFQHAHTTMRTHRRNIAKQKAVVVRTILTGTAEAAKPGEVSNEPT